MNSSFFLRCGALILAVRLTAGCGKPVLTKDNAGEIIPNGMSESKVYEILGTNAAVTFGKHGEKNLLYFLFLSAPPGIDVKIDTIEVVVSNGFVVNRHL